MCDMEYVIKKWKTTTTNVLQFSLKHSDSPRFSNYKNVQINLSVPINKIRFFESNFGVGVFSINIIIINPPLGSKGQTKLHLAKLNHELKKIRDNWR